MLLFFGLVGGFDGNKQQPNSTPDPIYDPMCDAICNEQYAFSFSKPLDAYVLSVSFETTEGETDVVEVIYNGTSAGNSSMLYEVSVTAHGDEILISSSHGQPLDNFVFDVNTVEISPSFVDSEETEVCGSVCTISDYTLDTDAVEPPATESTTIEELNHLYACSTSTSVGDLTMVAHNDDQTQALVIHETDGLDGPAGGYWENGFNNDNLTVELHVGTNVGVNHCTDDFINEEITEVFYPVDPSELPDDLIEDEVTAFDYGPQFLDCEGCEPFVTLTVENFWFRSDRDTYVKLELVNNLESDIWFGIGG